tara:strand:+ start:142 stop:378 length:237 start_codon:yes stop_codon:yes gene_type:complete
MKKLISIIFAFIIAITVNTKEAYASSTGDKIVDKDITLEDVESRNDNTKENKRNSTEDIFGDEQTFPFVAGLGKNAAH